MAKGTTNASGGGAELTTHINNTENPHGVTPEQIGAATMDEVNTAIQSAIGNAIAASY